MRTLRGRRDLAVLAALLAGGLTAAGVAGAGTAGATVAGSGRPASSRVAATCALTWGSLPKNTGEAATETAALTGARSGRHLCFDRLVLDGGSWARVRYVRQVVEDGSGRPVPLRGGARLEILTTRADDVNTGEPTFTPADPAEIADVAGYRTFRQVAFAGSFEGISTVGLGVRARLPFRVFVLDGGTPRTRVVIDVAHQW